jgi:inorganic pyrophosphatase
MHPWHDIPTREPGQPWVNAIIEIPQGSRNKYEVDKATGLLRLDRVLHSSMHYPVNYGILPRTQGPDSDPFDCLVFTEQPIQPLTLVRVRIFGVMRMIDQGVDDDKLMAVVTTDPAFAHIQSPIDLPPHTLTELRYFFEGYTDLEGKVVTIPGFDGPERALEILAEAEALYQASFGK